MGKAAFQHRPHAVGLGRSRYEHVREQYNAELSLLGFLVSRFKRQRKYQTTYLQKLKEHFGTDAFETVIPDLSTYEQAVTDRIPVNLHSPTLMPVPSPASSSPNSNAVLRKSSAVSAMSAAETAFRSPSSLSLGDAPAAVHPDQQGRRRLPNSYLIERSKISPDPLQPRKLFDEQGLADLAASIQSRGIKQPLTVRRDVVSATYRIIDGGRRYLASEKAGLTELPCWIQEGDSKDVLVDQIVHNWQRADLKPEETADALARLRDEFGLAQKAISELTGKPQSEISKFLAIHDWVAPDVQQMARDQSDTETPLTMRHLYNLSKLDDPTTQKALAQRVRDEKLTATQVEELVAKPRRQTVARKVGGVSLRQRRYQTTFAEVVINFRRPDVTRAQLLQVLDEIRASVELSDTSRV